MLAVGRLRRHRTRVNGLGATPARNAGSDADAVTNGCRLVPANTVTLLSGSMRTCISAPTRLSRLARTLPGHQPGAGEADLRLGRTGDDLAVGVAHDDVADAQRGAAAGVALELRAADRDAVIVAEILFDRGGEPRRREIEIDRPAAEPPPQRQHPDQHHARQPMAKAMAHAAPARPEAQRRQPP